MDAENRWVVIGAAVLAGFAGWGIKRSRRRLWTDPTPALPKELPDLAEELVLKIPPSGFLVDVDHGEQGECDWSAKYATAVEDTYQPSGWQVLRAVPGAAECARYEVIVASRLHSLENPEDTSEEWQVSYGWSWWEILKESVLRRYRLGASHEGLLRLSVQDYGPRWGIATTPPTHERSTVQFPGVPVRKQTEVMGKTMQYHESLYVQIRLEPGQREECFPQGFHDFFATAASSAKAELRWRCMNRLAHDSWAGPDCDNAAPADGSPPERVSGRVGGFVRCDQITQLNYDVVQSAGTSVAHAWGAEDVGATIEVDTSIAVPVGLGPFNLGTLTASLDSDAHPESSTVGEYVVRRPVAGTARTETLVLTFDTYHDASLELQSHKASNSDHSVSLSCENTVVHHARINGSTDEDAPCGCCMPQIELLLGSGLLPGGASAHRGAILMVGDRRYVLSHPGWASGSDWAPPGTVRAWQIAGSV